MDLSDPQVFETWELAAGALTFVVAALVGLYRRATGRYPTEQVRRGVAVGVYVVYALVGSAIRGEFDGMNWDTAEDVLASFIKVCMAGYAAYKTFGMLALNKTEGAQRVQDRAAGEPA